MKNPGVAVQGTLDKSQAGGVHERLILLQDVVNNPDFYNSFVVTSSATSQISHTKGGVLVGQGLGWEGSTNWSASGEGTGIRLMTDVNLKQPPGWKAQNNTLLVSANPVFLARFGARLDTEHKVGLMRRAVAEGK
jgi:hypothetical protein